MVARHAWCRESCNDAAPYSRAPAIAHRTPQHHGIKAGDGLVLGERRWRFRECSFHTARRSVSTGWASLRRCTANVEHGTEACAPITTEITGSEYCYIGPFLDRQRESRESEAQSGCYTGSRCTHPSPVTDASSGTGCQAVCHRSESIHSDPGPAEERQGSQGWHYKGWGNNRSGLAERFGTGRHSVWEEEAATSPHLDQGAIVKASGE